MFVKQIFEDFENLENKKESNLNKTCCCRPAVNSYNGECSRFSVNTE